MSCVAQPAVSQSGAAPTREDFVSDPELNSDFVNPFQSRAERREERALNNFGRYFYNLYQSTKEPAANLDATLNSDFIRLHSRLSGANLDSTAMSENNESAMDLGESGLADMSGAAGGKGGGGGGSNTRGSGTGLIMLSLARPIPSIANFWPDTVGKKMHYVVCGFNPFQSGTKKLNAANSTFLDAYVWPAMDLNVDCIINYLNPSEIIHLEKLILEGYTVSVDSISVVVTSKGTRTPYYANMGASAPQNGTLMIGGYCMTGVDRLIKQHPIKVSITSEPNSAEVGKVSDIKFDNIEKRTQDLLALNYGKVYEESVNMAILKNQIGADSVFRRPGYYLGELITTQKADGSALSLTSPKLSDFNAKYFNGRYAWKQHVSVFDAVLSGGEVIGSYSHKFKNCQLSRQEDLDRYYNAQFPAGGYVQNGVPFITHGYDGVSNYAIGTTATGEKSVNVNVASILSPSNARSQKLLNQILTDNNYANTSSNYKINEKIPAMHVGLEPVLAAPGVEISPTQYCEMEIYVDYNIKMKVTRKHNFKVPTWAGLIDIEKVVATKKVISNNLVELPTDTNVCTLPLTMGGFNHVVTPAASGIVILANRDSAAGPPNTLPEPA